MCQSRWDIDSKYDWKFSRTTIKVPTGQLTHQTLKNKCWTSWTKTYNEPRIQEHKKSLPMSRDGKNGKHISTH